MRERRKSRLPLLMAKGLGSIVMLAVILILGAAAVKFCLGLFLTGDYIVTIPSGPSPVLYRTDAPVGAAEKEESTLHSASATITVAGDLMMHMPIVNSGQAENGYNFDSIFTHVSSYITKADYAVVNLETTLSGADNGNSYTGYPQFNSPDAITDAAKTAGFDMLLTGNNHCNDYGTFGMKRTLDILSNRGLDTLGTTGTSADAKYVIRDINGIRVGMVCYTFAEIGDTADQPTVNSLQLDSNAAGLLNAFDYDRLDTFYSEMSAHIQNMQTEGAEAIVLFIHWGDEYSDQVSDAQSAIAQKMCDLGVDVIAGSHPHVVQKMELLTSTTDPSHRTVCAYSLGNFLSNQRADNIALTTGQSEDGLIFSFTLHKYSDGSVYVASVQALPTWVLIRGSGDGRSYQILPLDEATDWKNVYTLDDDQLSAAENSLARTEAVLTGLSDISTALNEAKAARDEAYAASAVG